MKQRHFALTAAVLAVIALLYATARGSYISGHEDGYSEGVTIGQIQEHERLLEPVCVDDPNSGPLHYAAAPYTLVTRMFDGQVAIIPKPLPFIRAALGEEAGRCPADEGGTPENAPHTGQQ